MFIDFLILQFLNYKSWLTIKYKKNKGFTIIEILIVIAIIALLAAMLMVYSVSVRNRAKDANIQKSLSQVRNLGEMLYLSQNSFSAPVILGDTSGMALLKADIVKNGGTSLKDFYAAGAYCIQYTLNETGKWCVDNTGYRGDIAHCDKTHYDCAAP